MLAKCGTYVFSRRTLSQADSVCVSLVKPPATKSLQRFRYEYLDAGGFRTEAYLDRDSHNSTPRISDAKARCDDVPAGRGAWAQGLALAAPIPHSASRLKRHPATPNCAATLTCAAVL